MYDLFLSSLLEDLETLLGLEATSEMNNINNSDVEAHRNSGGCLFSPKPSTFLGPLGSISLETRLKTMSRFLEIRASKYHEDDEWASVCAPDVMQRLPCPTYRRVVENESKNGFYDCQGISAVIRDAKLRVEFCENVSQNLHDSITSSISFYFYLSCR